MKKIIILFMKLIFRPTFLNSLAAYRARRAMGFEAYQLENASKKLILTDALKINT
jgi:hypothetical protein